MSSRSARILVVEDETHLAQGLFFNLQAEGHEVELAADGESALATLQNGPGFDAVILDVMLPGKDGFTVAQELRKQENYVPVLMLTARGRTEDVLKGFAAGADDYLPKPFDLSVLLARLQGLLRRVAWHAPVTEQADETPAKFEFAGRCIDFNALELTAPGRRIHLTVMEAEFLRHLVQNPGRIVSRKELLEQVWHVREDTDTRAIDNFVVRLRRYIEDEPANPVYLKTARGIGYRFTPHGE